MSHSAAFSRPHSHKSTRRLISLVVCLSMLLATFVMASPSRIYVSNAQDRPKGHAEPGSPEGTLPNLDEVRRRRHDAQQPPAHVPSLMRTRRKPLVPRNGLKVGDPGTTNGPVPGSASPGNKDIRAAAEVEREPKGNKRHGSLSQTASVGAVRARHHASAPLAPPISEVDYVGTFFSQGLWRGPSTNE